MAHVQVWSIIVVSGATKTDETASIIDELLLVLSDVLLPIVTVKLDVQPFDGRILPSLTENR